MAGRVDIGAGRDPDVGQARVAEHVRQPTTELQVGAVVADGGEEQHARIDSYSSA
jgi:hypothetical protein